MIDKKTYHIREIEDVIAAMDVIDMVDDVAEIDDVLELWIKGFAIVIPSLGICIRKGIACSFDKDANMFMPENDVTIIGGQVDCEDILYFKQDNILSTLEDYLNARSIADVTVLDGDRLSNLENLMCYIQVLNESN